MRHITRVLLMTIVVWAGVGFLAIEALTDFLGYGPRAQVGLAAATILASALAFVLTDYLKSQWVKVVEAYEASERYLDEESKKKGREAPRGNQE